MPLRQVTDGPIFGTEPGTLTGLQNMRLRPGLNGGHYAEARGGMEKLKPSGGASAEPVATGGTPAGIQVASSNGWIRTFATAGSVWTGNLQFSEGNYLPFSAGSVNDAYYFGADSPFARIGIKLQRAATWTVTLVYEYWDGAAWSALTTQETATWTATTTNIIDTYASWQVPSNWATTVVGNTSLGDILKYWMRIRISVSTVITTLPLIGSAFGSWNGMRELYLLSQQPYSAGPNGKLMRYDQASGGTVEYFGAATTMYSSPDATPSVAAYRGRLFATNPKETVRWDGRLLQNVGLAAPSGNTYARAAGGSLAVGIYRYYVAWGYGPVRNDVGSNVVWQDPTYGMSQATLCSVTAGADAADASSVQTTAGNQKITVDWSAVSIPADASYIVLYKTQDLTSIPVLSRSLVPATPFWALNRYGFVTVGTTSLTDDGLFPAFTDSAPGAILYDNKPPKGCRFMFTFENRLLLGGGPDSTWYYSDPFFPDQYNRGFQFISLTRANGGRDMGGIEYGGWGVLFTEDQTWGCQNLDQDVITLLPIHSGVGCIAPPSAAVGDGYLVWLARDGVYLWDGGKQGPKNVSGKFKAAFKQMSFEAHGGSRGVIHNHKYDLTLVDAKNGTIGNAYTLDLETLEWATRTTNDKKIPLCLIHAPLGHADAGVPHALYAKATVGTSSASDATSYSPCVAEYTTQDDGTSYTCLATSHFPVPPNALFRPDRVLNYYQAADGWATPTLSFTATVIGSGVGTLTAGNPNAGSDYSMIGGKFSQFGSGAADLKIQFSAVSAANGTVAGQRFFGSVLEGVVTGIGRYTA